MKPVDRIVIDGILLEDVATVETDDTPRDEGAENIKTVLVSFMAPFVVTVLSSWIIENGALWVWLCSLGIGMVFLARRLKPWEAALVAVVYFPLMITGLLFVMTTVPTGFHIVI